MTVGTFCLCTFTVNRKVRRKVGFRPALAQHDKKPACPVQNLLRQAHTKKTGDSAHSLCPNPTCPNPETSREKAMCLVTTFHQHPSAHLLHPSLPTTNTLLQLAQLTVSSGNNAMLKVF